MSHILCAVARALHHLELRPAPNRRARTGSVNGQAEAKDQAGSKPNAQAAQRPAPVDKQAEKIKRTVNKVAVGQRITVFLKNGDTMHGTLAQVGEDDFQISEVDRRQTFTLRYDEVKQVREALGSDEGRLRALSLEQGVRRHRRPVREALDVARADRLDGGED